MRYFPYGETEMNYLKKADPRLGKVITRIGKIDRPIEPDPFRALVSSIVGQQVSGKAAATVWGRLQERCGSITPESLGTMSLDDIQSCGMSRRKAEYIKGVADAALDGTVDFTLLNELPDEEVSAKLTTLRCRALDCGNGLDLFSSAAQCPQLGRSRNPQGIQLLYQLEELSKKEFEAYRERYSPYGSIASLYLWEIAGNPDYVREL